MQSLNIELFSKSNHPQVYNVVAISSTTYGGKWNISVQSNEGERFRMKVIKIQGA